MYQPTVRSTTANPAKTVLALVAILSLLLSLFAIVRPAIAFHGDGVPEVTPTVQNFPGGGPSCPDGSIGIRFGDSADDDGPLSEGSEVTVTFPDTTQATVTIVSLDDNKLEFAVEGGLASKVFVKGGTGNQQNVYDYTGQAGGGAAHDDGLQTPPGTGISHVDFCVIPVEASIIVYKTDQLGNDVEGAVFEVWDGATKVAGPESTGADGLVCFDGLVLDKTYTVVETDAPDGWLPADPDNQQVVAAAGTCDERTGDDPDATFTNTRVGSLIVLKTDDNATTPMALAGAEFTVNSVTQTTGDDGRTCFDGLVAGDLYDVTETTPPPGYEPADPATVEDVEALAGTCADRAQDDPDVTFTNALTPGSLIVLKTDDDEQSPTPLAGAEFTVDGITQTTGDDGITCFDGLVAGDAYDVTETTPPPGYLPADPATVEDVIAGSGTCADRAEDEPDVTFTNVPEVLGSITINKEIECEECETRTPGFWFNAAGSHDDETNALMAELAAADGGDTSVIEVNIDGTVHTFADAQDVRDFVEADRSGESDDEPGLSRDGALLRHYLSTWLNVALNGEECDLLSRMLGTQTVEAILAEAAAALEADDEAAEVEALEKLTAINESDDADENPLTCGDSEGTSGDGFMFELFAEADFPDGDPIDTGTTGDDGPGTLVFDELPLGTYVLVETGNDSEQECEIVSVDGGVLNADGTVTVEITEETPDVVLTVVNECEGGEGEENPGDITVIKEAGEDETTEFAFSATWDTDGFVLTDGDSEFSGDLEAGEFTVTETLTAEQIAAGWSLVDIDCGDADVTLVDSSVTITLGEGESVTCTFTNELDEEEENGLVEIDKLFCFTDEEASTEFFVFGPSPLPEVTTFGQEETPEEGCWTEAVSFTITGGDLEEPLEVMTDENGILEIELPASENAYVITEDLSGESAEFFVEDGAITTIAVLNLVPEDEAGLVKVIKLFCEAEGEPTVSFSVEGGDAPVPVISDCEVGDATFELGDMTIETEGGIAINLVDVGEYTFAEVDPNEATFDGTVVVEEGEITTIIVINTFEEGEQGGEGPGQNETPREGTQGGSGGPSGGLPNTATSPIPTGSVPAALLALLMLAGLGAAGYAVRAEAHRRR